MFKKVMITVTRLSIFVGIIVFACFVSNKVQQTKQMVHVEQYCSVTNAHDVEAYKECRELTPIQILDELKQRESTLSNVPKLPPLQEI